MRSILVFLAIFGLTLTSCTPALTSDQDWVGAIFNPSQANIDFACRSGMQAAQATNRSVLTPGVSSKRTRKGTITLQSALSGTFLHCLPNGFSGIPPTEIPRFTTFVYVDGSVVSIDKTSLYFEFYDRSGQTLGQINSYDNSKGDFDSSYYYRLPTLSDREISLINSSGAFAVILDQGFGKEKFIFQRSDFSGLP
jgi:hypothetical protein